MTFQELETIRIAYDTKRRKILRINLIIFGIFSIVGLLQVLFTGADLETCLITAVMALFMTGIWFAIAALVTTAIFTHKESIAFHRAYKSYFVSSSLARTFTDLHYDHEQGMPRNVIADTQMIRMGDRYSSNDFVSAKYHNLHFFQADVHLESEESDSDGHTTYITLFKGRWLVFEFKKQFNFQLQVTGKSFRNSRLPSGQKFQKITTESPTFNQNFNISAGDGFEAFYLLDPAFMERIEQLGAKYDGRIMLCFSGHSLHIAICDGKDSFEPPSPAHPIDEQAEFAKVSTDIKVITDLIDHLKLDR